MLAVTLINSLVVVIAVVIHYECLLRLNDWMPRLKIWSRFRIVVGVLGSLLAHAIEVWAFAVVYFLMSRAGEWGQLTGNFDGSLMDCVYFSFTTYTTIGFGDANVLGIPGYTSFRYGVLHSNIQFTDPSGGDAMSQTFEMFDETWRRRMLNLDAWGEWYLVGGRTQVVSNANGEAWLYADGTMTAVANIDGIGFANSIPAYKTWTYPRVFVGSPPKVLVTMSRPSLDITALAARTYTPGLASVQMAHNSTAQAGCSFVCLAMGRWK